MQEPALSHRQQEAAEALKVCEEKLSLWDQHSRRVRIPLLEALLDARKHYNAVRYNETSERRQS
jgi:hypothetical protein